MPPSALPSSPSAAPPRTEAGRDVALAAFLGCAGLLVLVGGALHPFLPTDHAGQLAAMLKRIWEPAHWLLTLGQGLAAGAVPAFLLGRQAQRPGLWRGASLLFGVGLAFGAIGTLLPATVLPDLVAAGDPSIEGIVGADLAIGWMCSLLSSVAALLLALAHGRSAALPRAIVWFAGLGGLVLAIATAATPYDHHLTHNVVLRVGALSLGVGLLALAWTAWRDPQRA